MSDDNLYELYATSPYIQGDVGEVVTASELRSRCGMKVLRNIYLPYNGKLTEIDMVAFSKLGVFIIENKNYSGEIIGSLNDKYWKVRYSSIHYEKLYNPVFQNIRHKNAVERYLKTNNLRGIPIFRPVIFSDKVKLSLRDCEKSVFTLSDFIDTYNSLDVCNLDDILINNLLDYFRPLSNQSYEMRLVHLGLMDRRV